MLIEIEREIEKYFSLKWKEKDILFWIGKKRFEIDVPSLDKNLRKPIVNFILRGGKRWRPMLFLTTLKLLGKEWRKHLDIAFAIELAHNATLIIDDIEDSASLRRGKPTSHIIYGLDIAINAGSAIHFLPLRVLLNKKNLTEKQRLSLIEVYLEEIINVYFGQTLDIAWHKNPHAISINKYLEMTRLKTGGLVRMAGRMACILAHKEKMEGDIIKFSELAGIAFQIKDDALEFESDEKTFGKSFGNDISEGKMSLPVIFALQSLSKSKKNRLLQILTFHTKDKKMLNEAMGIIKNSGAVKKSLEYADKLIEKAWNDVESKFLYAKKKDLEDFKSITYSLVKRNK